MPVAENPQLYSQTQIANFLRSSQLNQVIEKSQHLAQTSRSVANEKFSSNALGSHCYDADADAVGSSAPMHSPDGSNPSKRDVTNTRDACGDGSEEGGFILEMPKSGSPEQRLSRDEVSARLLNEWKCAQCTMYNSDNEAKCVLCGHPAPRCNVTPCSSSTLILQGSHLGGKCGGGELEHAFSHRDELSGEKAAATATNSDGDDSDSDSWESNDFSSEVAPAITGASSAHVQGGSNMTATLFAGSDQCNGERVQCSDDLLSRAVRSARNMGDWAGRAVRLALKHRAQGLESTVSAGEEFITDEEVSTSPPRYWEPALSKLESVEGKQSSTSVGAEAINDAKPSHGYTSKEVRVDVCKRDIINVDYYLTHYVVARIRISGGDEATAGCL
jgi:hypothetical protein